MKGGNTAWLKQREEVVPLYEKKILLTTEIYFYHIATPQTSVVPKTHCQMRLCQVFITDDSTYHALYFQSNPGRSTVSTPRSRVWARQVHYVTVNHVLCNVITLWGNASSATNDHSNSEQLKTWQAECDHSPALWIKTHKSCDLEVHIQAFPLFFTLFKKRCSLSDCWQSMDRHWKSPVLPHSSVCCSAY